MNGVFLPDRWEEIINFIEENGNVTVEEIAEKLKISPATARRDIVKIHEKGLISRTRGGAAPGPYLRAGQTIAESRKVNPEEKEIIGKAASKLVKNGDVIMVDGGFTTYQAVRYIEARPLTVVTTSVDVVQALARRDDVKLVVVGGELNMLVGATAGPAAEQQILGLMADKAILGADALSPEHGLSCSGPLIAQNKKAMIARSREIIVLADHTKLGVVALYNVVQPDKINILVTSDKADKDILDAFRKSGVEVITASSDII